MRFWLFSILMVWSASAQAAELATIERRLAKEPVYHAKPKYGLLVFGPCPVARPIDPGTIAPRGLTREAMRVLFLFKT